MAQQVSWQEYQSLQIRSAAILTNAYVAGTVLGVPVTSSPMTADHIEQINFLALEVGFTIGSLTSITLKIEFSEDNTNFYIIGSGANSSGVVTISPGTLLINATGNYYLDINGIFFSGGGFKTRYIRVSAIGTGTVTSSSLSINAVYGVA